MENLISLLIFFICLSLGYFVGRYKEKKHYKSIRIREKRYRKISVTTFKNVPSDKNIASAYFVSGSVVISIDYLKKILASLRFIFGGNVGSYETLIDRGRREAILRMIEKSNKPDIILNLKIETSAISGRGRNKNSVGSIEVFAYGTAVKYE